jgi:selenocysteine lyase/cysteine desulfurase
VPGLAGCGGNTASSGGTASKSIRSKIVGLDAEVKLADGSMVPAINLDNAATTPAFTPVLEEVNDQLALYGSIGRGWGQKSTHSTELYEQGRRAVMDFVNAAANKYTVFYAVNTTDGLNKLSSALITSKDDIVLTTRMEHHANDLVWRRRATPIYVDVDKKGRPLLNDVSRLLRENQVRYVSITAASNVTGYVNDVHAVARLAHQHGAQIIVDGAQISAHRAFNMKGQTPEEDIDYFVFSAHKMYAPYGGDAVVGLVDELNKHMPQFYGGGMVNVVTDSTETYLDAPARYEAGSPNYPGVVAMLRAIKMLKEVGFGYIVEHEQMLMRRTIDGMRDIPGLTLYGDTDKIADKVGIVVFNIHGMAPSDVAQQLAEKRGIAVRQGAFCSHPYVFRLLRISDAEIRKKMQRPDFGIPGMVRASFGIYNNEKEVDVLLETVREIAEKRAAGGNGGGASTAGRKYRSEFV